MDVIKALNWRYAINCFSDAIVSECNLHRLLEALRPKVRPGADDFAVVL